MNQPAAPQPVHPDDTPLTQRKGGSYIKPKPEQAPEPEAETSLQKLQTKKGR